MRWFVQSVRRFLISLALTLFCAAASAQTRDPNEFFFQPFLGDFNSELEVARKENKRGVLLVYEMEECPFCERFHKTVLRESAVQDFYRKHFLIFRVDIKGGSPVRAFDGKELVESAFASANRVRATPTSVIYDLSGRELTRYTGPTRDAREFILFGQYVLDEGYKGMPFSQYKLVPGR